MGGGIYRDVTAFILAGGRNSRMGKDKAFLDIAGEPMIGCVIEALKGIFNAIEIITNNPAEYKEFGLPVRTDIIPGCGPLGGIYTALSLSRAEYNFIASCDSPFLDRGLIRRIAGVIPGYDVCVPEFRGRLYPLCAAYAKSCLPVIERQLKKKEFKITVFFKDINVKILPEEEVMRFDGEGRSFININTPEDYQLYGAKVDKRR